MHYVIVYHGSLYCYCNLRNTCDYYSHSNNSDKDGGWIVSKATLNCLHDQPNLLVLTGIIHAHGSGTDDTAFSLQAVNWPCNRSVIIALHWINVYSIAFPTGNSINFLLLRFVCPSKTVHCTATEEDGGTNHTVHFISERWSLIDWYADSSWLDFQTAIAIDFLIQIHPGALNRNDRYIVHAYYDQTGSCCVQGWIGAHHQPTGEAEEQRSAADRSVFISLSAPYNFSWAVIRTSCFTYTIIYFLLSLTYKTAVRRLYLMQSLWIRTIIGGILRKLALIALTRQVCKLVL